MSIECKVTNGVLEIAYFIDQGQGERQMIDNTARGNPIKDFISLSSPAAMKLGRDAFYAVWDMAAPEALAHLHAMLSLTAQTEDAAEGIAAFLEKRAPHWQGR